MTGSEPAFADAVPLLDAEWSLLNEKTARPAFSDISDRRHSPGAWRWRRGPGVEQPVAPEGERAAQERLAAPAQRPEQVPARAQARGLAVVPLGPRATRQPD